MRLRHIVPTGTEPFEQENGASRGLDRHHHHQHPGGEVERLQEGRRGDDPRPLGHQDGDARLEEGDGEVNHRFSDISKEMLNKLQPSVSSPAKFLFNFYGLLNKAKQVKTK